MAFEALKDHKYFEDVHARLCAGIQPEKVAEWLHMEGQFLTLKVDSLARNLYRYRKTIPPQDLPHRGVNAAVVERLKDFKAGLNEVTELEKLYALQMSRIATGLEVEDKTKFIQRGVRAEMELAANILGKVAELKFKHGIYKAAPMTVDVTATMRAEATAILDKLPEDRKAQLGGVAQQMLQGLAGLLSAGPSGEAPVDAEWEEIPVLGDTGT